MSPQSTGRRSRSSGPATGKRCKNLRRNAPIEAPAFAIQLLEPVIGVFRWHEAAEFRIAANLSAARGQRRFVAGAAERISPVGLAKPVLDIFHPTIGAGRSGWAPCRS